MISKGWSLSAWAGVAGAVAVVVAFSAGVARAEMAKAENILNSRCTACHERLADGGLKRISKIRKTPEGWDMTIVRMMLVHGVKVGADERKALVKHLADTQGLAPEEAAGFRYILERDPSTEESPPDETLAVMCGRCHSYARVALQRRNTDDWLKHSHFHLGQWPTTEYQALGRDRNWWEIASTEVPKKLGKLYPFKTAAWDKYRGYKAKDLSGSWRIAGSRPGKGDFTGVATLSGSGGDKYAVKMDMAYADGTKVSGSGNAIVYTGYEWRASLRLGDEDVLQVLALSDGGNALSGRWFLEAQDSLGGAMQARRIGAGGAKIMQVSPAHIKAGQTAEIKIHGTGLSGMVNLGSGVDIVSTISSSANSIVVRAKAAASAATGAQTVTVGLADATGMFAVYKQVDSIRVEPAYTIARVGGAGGPLPPVPAQFEAIAFGNGADGKAGTDDDVRIGAMKASWSVSNFGEAAAAMKDDQFAGKLKGNGLFVPAAAGLNPKRPFSTNNVGDLSVNAAIDDGGRKLEGSGHLVVTVQRWNDPPIR